MPHLIRAILSVLLLSVLFSGCGKHQPRVLIFSKTKGYVHGSIPYAIDAVRKLGVEHGFDTDTTKDASFFTEDNLEEYDAVIFLSTTGNVLNAQQQTAFERYIQSGGGFVGIHSAAASEYEWAWYNKLIGAHFLNHPHNPNVRKATVTVSDKTHAATMGLPERWERTDEWYNYRTFYPGIKVLASLDENSYEGGTHGGNHPIAWYHEYDGGRSFYTGGGHTNENYSEPLFLQHILGGIKYAIGDGKRDASKAYAVVVPEENRFVKTVLVNDLDTPMELAISDDGELYYTELRSGRVMLFDTRTGASKLVHQFKLEKRGGTGLIGITLDPSFKRNRYVYLYYSPPAEKEPFIFNLSRFVIRPDNTLDVKSEKVLLTVPVEENSGAHHGGSLAWDKDGNLYLSTGDSSSPFPSNGYPPLDERPGSEFFSLDAQRSSSNTNDLKGKILRIHPEPDGTYTIPDGNLFTTGTAKTRPEIYVMGCRNPYRIAVNPKNHTVYWGDIGPDAGRDSVQGPKGYDEFNQARVAGNFGWPYFIGDNKAYAKWDFSTSTAGPLFDAKAPVNNSPNNTGLNTLPPAQPAMIWYPYDASVEFPSLGKGGRSAMAGSFYTFDHTIPSEKKFPDYYDGSLFVFDWMRNWVLALRFDEQENFVRSEPFMASNGDFRRPIDLTFGKDGVLYMLEYGSVYGADNDDARLVKIEYNSGNRPPKAVAAIVDSAAAAAQSRRVFLTSETKVTAVAKSITGRVPLRVSLSSNDSQDPDDDDVITFKWDFRDGATSSEKNPIHVFTKPGIYEIILTVTDLKGSSQSDTLSVTAGNETPRITFETANNTTFYSLPKPFRYMLKVVDHEDQQIDWKNVNLTLEYQPVPRMSGNTAVPLGITLMEGSDCKACHTQDRKSVGPSWLDVARRYKGKKATDMLAGKVIAGGGGAWGTDHVMSAHPQLEFDEAKTIVSYILSLADTHKERSVIPMQGTIKFDQHKVDEPLGRYVLEASYTDKGNGAIKPIRNTATIALRNPTQLTIYADSYSGFERFGNWLTSGNHKSYYLFRDIDLTAVSGFTYDYSSEKLDGEIEVRRDSYAGPVISTVKFVPTGKGSNVVTGSINSPLTGHHDLYFILIRKEKPQEELANVKSITFNMK
jgi:cytochrome c